MKKRFIDFVEHEVKEFRIVGFEFGNKVDIKFTLDDEFDNEDPYEWINTFQEYEYFNAINKLEVNECLFVKLSRDEEQVKGVITRIK